MPINVDLKEAVESFINGVCSQYPPPAQFTIEATLEFAVRRGSRCVVSSYIRRCECGELAHAIKHPRDRPRTHDTLSERLAKTFSFRAAASLFCRSSARSTPVRSRSFRVIDRSNRPLVARPLTRRPDPPHSFALVVVGDGSDPLLAVAAQRVPEPRRARRQPSPARSSAVRRWSGAQSAC